MAIEGSKQNSAKRRIRLGMIGGGEGAFIGAVHRLAARMDDDYDFVCGALSATPEKAIRSGAAIGLDPRRTYPDYTTMLKRERRLADGAQAIAIVTPNDTHVAAAIACLKAGMHVICDKPLAATLQQGRKLQEAAAGSDRLFAVTYTYTGYPMIRQARSMVAAGELGRLRVVQVEYAQDWLAEPLEKSGHKQALWRTDPAKSGAGGAIGDIGTHAFNLAEFVTGETVTALAADLQSFVKGRRVDDNAHILLRFAGGARGFLWASQVSPGHENGLRLRIYGEKAGLEWQQEHPNHLRFARLGQPVVTLTRGGAGTVEAASRLTRVPAGHPEGYLEAFANIYAEIARAIRAHDSKSRPDKAITFPGLDDGMRGLQFVDAALRSSRRNSRWTPLSP